MNRNRWFAAAMLAIAALSYGVYRLYVHARGLAPAIITPRMNAQQELSPSLSAHVKRLIDEHVQYGNRSGRPKLIALTFAGFL